FLLSIINLLYKNDSISTTNQLEINSSNIETHTDFQNTHDLIVGNDDTSTNVNNNEQYRQNDSLQHNGMRPQNLTMQFQQEVTLPLKGDVAHILEIQSEPSQFYTISAL